MENFFLFLSNRLTSLLLFVLLMSSSCNFLLKGQGLPITTHSYNEVSNYYPLEVAISFEETGVATLNYKGPLGSTAISFFNTEKPFNVITKTILSTSSQNQMFTVLSIKKTEGLFRFRFKVFFVDEGHSFLNLKFQNGELSFPDADESSNLDELIDAYFNLDLGAEILRLKNNKRGQEHSASLKRKLDSVYSKYSDMYPDKASRLGMVNDISYYSRLQIIEPLSPRVEAFIKKSNFSMILDDTFSGLFYGYVNNRISSFSFEQLNKTHYSDNSLYRIAQGIYQYLIQPENQINPQQEEALTWLRTTSFYQNYALEIEESLEKVKGKELTYFLKNLWVLDESFKGHLLEDVLKSNPSKYYLLDFWATWCAPCIQGFIDIKKMQLPKNLTLIHLSVDKYEVKDKWKSKTIEFGLNNSYLIDQVKNRAFFEIFQLEAIPRYMILDHQFNVVNINMFHPHEPQFLEYLNELTDLKE